MKVYIAIPQKNILLPVRNDPNEIFDFVESFGTDIIGAVMQIKGFSSLIIENVTVDEVEICFFCR